jgi:hypothetical protein
MILVAGLAAGMALVRMSTPDISPGQLREAILHPKGGWSFWYAIEITLELGTIFAIPFMAAWTPACLLVQLSKPRWRRLRRQPGFVACLIATAVSIVTLAGASTCIRFSLWDVNNTSGEIVKAHLLGGFLAGSGVLWGGVTMRLCGVCRPSPTWRDRLGRLTGAVWIALGAISAGYIFLALD